MKIDISIPNPIFEAAEQLAQKMGMSLSDLYTAAIANYVATYQSGNITEILDQVYEAEPSPIDPVLLKIQTASVAGETW